MFLSRLKKQQTSGLAPPTVARSLFSVFCRHRIFKFLAFSATRIVHRYPSRHLQEIVISSIARNICQGRSKSSPVPFGLESDKCFYWPRAFQSSETSRLPPSPLLSTTTNSTLQPHNHHPFVLILSSASAYISSSYLSSKAKASPVNRTTTDANTEGNEQENKPEKVGTQAHYFYQLTVTS